MPSRDFTKKRDDVFFTVDDDRFDCWPGLIADDLKALGEVMGEGISVDNAVEKLYAVFNIVMQRESFNRFDERMHDRMRPIDLRQFTDIIEWLVEVYTGRPTQPSSTSSSGSGNGDAGSSSTAGAPAETSTLPISTQVDSLTSSTTT